MSESFYKEGTKFNLYLVPDEYFCNNPTCPHCHSSAHPEMLYMFGEMGVKLVGDIMLCTDCHEVFIVVENPTISTEFPILTSWSVPEKISQKGYYYKGGVRYELN